MPLPLLHPPSILGWRNWCPGEPQTPLTPTCPHPSLVLPPFSFCSQKPPPVPHPSPSLPVPLSSSGATGRTRWAVRSSAVAIGCGGGRTPLAGGRSRRRGTPLMRHGAEAFRQAPSFAPVSPLRRPSVRPSVGALPVSQSSSDCIYNEQKADRLHNTDRT